MGHHHKAASCSAIPSFQSFTSVPTNTTQIDSLGLFDQPQQQQQYNKSPQSNVNRSISPSLTKSYSQQSISSQQQPFPLPSFCLYSNRALVNEYAPESDIIQFLAPVSAVLEERLPMFVGVLQSLFTVVNDMPFINDREHDEDNIEEEDDDDDEDEEEEEAESLNKEDEPFTIIGLETMKLVIWNCMYDNIVEKDIYEKDLCLVVMVSAQVTDELILENMNLLLKSVTSLSSSNIVTAKEIGEQLIPLVEYWFNMQ